MRGLPVGARIPCHVWNENSQSDEIRLNFRNVGKAPTLTSVGVRIIIHQFLHPLMGHTITIYLILETDVMYMRNYILLSKDQVLDEVAKGKAHTTSSHSFISTLALGPNPKAPVPWRIIIQQEQPLLELILKRTIHTFMPIPLTQRTPFFSINLPAPFPCHHTLFVWSRCLSRCRRSHSR